MAPRPKSFHLTFTNGFARTPRVVETVATKLPDGQFFVSMASSGGLPGCIFCLKKDRPCASQMVSQPVSAGPLAVFVGEAKNFCMVDICSKRQTDTEG